MSFSSDDNSTQPIDLNPILAFWALPYKMTQAWMTSFLKMGTGQQILSAPEPHVVAPPKNESGQIPVPAPLEKDNESKMFA